MSSVAFRSVDRAHIQQAVTAYVTQLRRKYPEIERAIWFGSWISGLPTPGSDVDLCLILSASDQPPRERVSDYLPLGFPVGIDLFVYTRDEFKRLQHSSPGWYSAIIAGVDM